MSIKGSSYGNFRRALDTRNLTIIRAAAAELPKINLEDALRVALLVCRHEPENAERAALRWLGRYCLERRTATLADLSLAVAAFSVMPHDRERGAAILRQLAGR